MIALDEYNWSREANILFYLGIGIVSICISMLMYRNILFGIVIIPFVPRIRGYITDFLIDKRKTEFISQFKDFLFLAATSIGAGRSMIQAITESIPGIEEIYGEDAILVTWLRDIERRCEENHEDDVSVLSDAAVMTGIDDVVDFAMMYQVCKITGANLITSMNRASVMIIDKMTIDKEIREITKRKELEGMFIFVMPVLVILLLNISSPDYIAPLYNSLFGRIIMTVVIASDILIFGMIKKITGVKL